jgi:tetratricopeptide (TPR) repeat protein
MLLTWLGGILLASHCDESAFSAATVGFGVGAVYLIVRAITLTITSDAAMLFSVTLWWFVLLAAIGGVWLRAPTKGLRFWIGPVGMLYPILAVIAVVFIIVAAVRPVQADIYFQSAMANYSTAVATDDRERFQDAEKLFARATTYNPNEPLYPMKWGELYMQLGSSVLAVAQPGFETAAANAFGRAQDLLITAEELEPLMPYHAYNRGLLQLLFAQSLGDELQTQRLEIATNAAIAFEDAFEVLKYDPQVANNYALARLLEGKTDEAIGLLEYSTSLDSERAETYMLLGQAYATAGMTAEAQEAIERASTLGGGGAQALATLGDLAREAGDLAGALNYYEQAAAEDPNNWMILFNLGLLYDELGDTEKAMEALVRAQGVAPPTEAQRIQGALETILGTGVVAPP